MASPAHVDVCIVNYFGAADVERAVADLGTLPSGRMWLVDNSADPAQLAQLRALAVERPDVEVLAPHSNLGYGRGCNLVFEQSRAEFLLLLNPDASITAPDVQVLVDSLFADPQLAAVSPRTYWSPRRDFLLPGGFPQTPVVLVLLSLATRAGALTRSVAAGYIRRQREAMAGAAPFTVDFVTGAVLLLRRSAVLAAGGLFDPTYFMFFEDSDLSLRLRRHGWKLAIAPAAEAVHEYRHKAYKGPMMSTSRDAYFRKNFPWFAPWLGCVDAVARRTAPAPPCRSRTDLERLAGGAGVVAFSPSPVLMPAVFRPAGVEPAGLSQADWELLEPATYTAVLADGRWIVFEKL
jgi:GT2 family glycosyltransferase